MKKKIFLIVLFINVFCLGQTKIYLDKNISIIIINGNKAIGHCGIKIFKNSIPFSQNPRTNIDKPKVKEIHNIIIK